MHRTSVHNLKAHQTGVALCILPPTGSPVGGVEATCFQVDEQAPEKGV